MTDPYNLYFTPDGRCAIVVAEAALSSTSAPAQDAAHACARGAVPRRGPHGLHRPGHRAARELRVLRPDGRRERGAQRVVRTVRLPSRAACLRTSSSPRTGGRSSSPTWPRRRLADRRGHLPHPRFTQPAPARTASIRAATRAACTSPTVARDDQRDELRHPSHHHDVADPGRHAGHGRRLRRRQVCGSRAATTARSTRSTRGPAACAPYPRRAAGPHGLCVWPQPGRYSLGHTGILRPPPPPTSLPPRDAGDERTSAPRRTRRRTRGRTRHRCQGRDDPSPTRSAVGVGDAMDDRERDRCHGLSEKVPRRANRTVDMPPLPGRTQVADPLATQYGE